jgi:hypothetical protein
MKSHQRRATQSYPYFKVAVFDSVSMCFRDGKQAFETEDAAKRAAKSPGTYRISTVTASGRVDSEKFTVA